MSMDII